MPNSRGLVKWVPLHMILCIWSQYRLKEIYFPRNKPAREKNLFSQNLEQTDQEKKLFFPGRFVPDSGQKINGFRRPEPGCVDWSCIHLSRVAHSPIKVVLGWKRRFVAFQNFQIFEDRSSTAREILILVRSPVISQILEQTGIWKQ